LCCVPTDLTSSCGWGDRHLGKFASATCPGNSRLHGTGGSLSGAIGQAAIDRVGLFGAGATAGSDIEAYEDVTGFSGNWSATAYAICAY
jgi:hypothetical protein